MATTDARQICEDECTSSCHSAECEHHGYTDNSECDRWCTSGCHSDTCEHHD